MEHPWSNDKSCSGKLIATWMKGILNPKYPNKNTPWVPICLRTGWCPNSHPPEFLCISEALSAFGHTGHLRASFLRNAPFVRIYPLTAKHRPSRWTILESGGYTGNHSVTHPTGCFFLNGTPLKFLSVRLHSKCHQKSSKCQNLLTGKNLWFLGGSQLKKKTPCTL